jgi:adenine phosphoribosyltransferase
LPNIVADPQTLAEVAEVLGRPARAAGVTAIASIQARGWLFASAVAHHLGLGLVPILNGRRMDDRGDFEEERYVHRSEPDPEPLSVLRHLVQGKRVLLVDYWLESGEQALAARRLIEKTGGEWGGVSALCDGLKDESVRTLLKPIAAACRPRRNQWCVL